MLVGLAGLLSGYRGQFEFKSGESYPADVNYVGMRIILAMFGVAMVPIAFSTTGALGWNWRARHFVATMVLLGELRESRMIVIISKRSIASAHSPLLIPFFQITLGS